ncbi:hypothetical protein PoB_004242200 [Plakobranchus ocellatus]|uniref:Uncharacterized protein n=1 Tax=Plakobranchus ocellatus TaxID=259542 RepID=A0AAV4B9W5_9GAST|nr:hypothetical protein PoB_004242200 [Plakobranchus ocellatus]
MEGPPFGQAGEKRDTHWIDLCDARASPLMRQDEKMTDRYSPRPQSNYQSLEDLRNVRFTEGVSTHSNSSSSMSRSCGETPENAWSFR